MTSEHDDQELEDAPGLGDPHKSDDRDIPNLRQGGAGRGAPGQLTGPAPSGDADRTAAVDTGESGPQGGQLGSAGGGYGSGSAAGTSGGTPDGEDVQAQAGPGPQTEWLRSAQGMGDPETDELGR